MVEEVSARARTNNSANLTMTGEYLVVKGKHFQVRNGYLNCSNQTQAVSVKDILSMEYLTMRSKRLFILFMILTTFAVHKDIVLGFASVTIPQIGFLYLVEKFYCGRYHVQCAVACVRLGMLHHF